MGGAKGFGERVKRGGERRETDGRRRPAGQWGMRAVAWHRRGGESTRPGGLRGYASDWAARARSRDAQPSDRHGHASGGARSYTDDRSRSATRECTGGVCSKVPINVGTLPRPNKPFAANGRFLQEIVLPKLAACSNVPISARRHDAKTCPLQQMAGSGKESLFPHREDQCQMLQTAVLAGRFCTKARFLPRLGPYLALFAERTATMCISARQEPLV